MIYIEFAAMYGDYTARFGGSVDPMKYSLDAKGTRAMIDYAWMLVTPAVNIWKHSMLVKSHVGVEYIPSQ